MPRYLQSWIDQLRWQRLEPFQKLAYMLLDHPDGILNYCRTKVRLGVVEAINGNIKTLLTAEHFRLAKLLAIPITVSIHRARLYEWAAIYAAERKQLLRSLGPVPGSLLAGDPPLPN
jgi:hypothetical protein